MRFHRRNSSLSRLLGLLMLCGVQASVLSPARAQSARQLYLQGIQFDEQKRYTDAIQRFEEARRKAPDLHRILLLLGGVHIKLRNSEQAIDLFDLFQQEERTPDGEEQGLLQSGYIELQAILKEQQQQNPERTELYLFAARTAYRLKQWRRAWDLFVRHEQIRPNPREAEAKRRAQYLREFHEAVVSQIPSTTQRENPELLLLIAESHFALQHEEAAIDAIDLFRELRPEATPNPRMTNLLERLAARLVSESGGAVLLMGRTQFWLAHLEQAAALYARYRQESPTPPTAYAERQVKYEADLQATLDRQRREAELRQAQEASLRAAEAVRRAQQEADERRKLTEQRARVNRWLLGSGAASIAVGGGLLSVGAVAVTYDGKCIDDSQPCDRVYDSLNVGIGTLAAGGALILGGCTLIGLGIARARPATASRSGAKDTRR